MTFFTGTSRDLMARRPNKLNFGQSCCFHLPPQPFKYCFVTPFCPLHPLKASNSTQSTQTFVIVSQMCLATCTFWNHSMNALRPAGMRRHCPVLAAICLWLIIYSCGAFFARLLGTRFGIDDTLRCLAYSRFRNQGQEVAPSPLHQSTL